MTKRRKHSAAYKGKVALEAAKEIKTLNDLASQYSIHPTQISQWKAQLLEAVPLIFSKKKALRDSSKQIDDLHRLIGEISVERDWLKKKLENLR